MLEGEEVERRAGSTLGTAFLRPERPLQAVPGKPRSLVTGLLRDSQRAQFTDAKREVTLSKLKHDAERDFHGKEVLRYFYAAHLHKSALSKVVFAFRSSETCPSPQGRADLFRGLFFLTVNRAWKLPDEARRLAPLASVPRGRSPGRPERATRSWLSVPGGLRMPVRFTRALAYDATRPGTLCVPLSGSARRTTRVYPERRPVRHAECPHGGMLSGGRCPSFARSRPESRRDKQRRAQRWRYARSCPIPGCAAP